MIVETKDGLIRGVEEGEVAIFRGIPYAAPPVGELRFKPPQAPLPWQGVLSAEKFGPIAPQVVPGNSVSRTQSEDCLSLNIWTSKQAHSGKDQQGRPVLLNIHGGAFIAGTGADFDGSKYVREDGIVCVSINYRLGTLGFLYLGDLLGEAYRTSGNNGLLDMIAALTWVREHISAFGGDPNRVTIMGNSAGAKGVATLLTVPAASGLFHGAIAQSGATQSVRDAETATRVSLRLLEALGIRREEADKLLEVPFETIVKHQDPHLHSYGPVFDGITIPMAPLDAIREGACNRVPLLLGSNKEEAATYMYLSPEMKKPDDSYLIPMFGANRELVLDRYRALSANPAANLSPSDAWGSTLTDCLYRIATVRLAEAAAENRFPVWLYRFEFPGFIGAGHGVEGAFIADSEARLEDVPYEFRMYTVVPAEGKGLAQKMRAAWVAFIHTGNPNIEGLPEWPSFDVHGRNLMRLDTECCVGEEPLLKADHFPNQVFKLI